MAMLVRWIKSGPAAEVPARPAVATGLTFAGLRGAVLRRVRVLAWRVLDLETEIEVLD